MCKTASKTTALFPDGCHVQVTFTRSDVTVSEILKVIQDAGFTAELLQKQDLEARQEVSLSLRASRQFDRYTHACLS